MKDIIIIGGSFAGISAALQLGRARRTVTLVDAELPRNRFASEAHGIIGHDGKPPATLRAEAMAQLRRYESVEVITGNVISARPGFEVTLDGGKTLAAKRLILATGVVDELPPIAGLSERWGRSVLHCPYCHGYEVRDQALGVLATMAQSAHQGLLIPDWGPTTYFTQGTFEPEMPLPRAHIERRPIVELLGKAPALEAVRLADGTVVPLHALFIAPKTHLSPLATALGCALDEGPTGPYIRVDMRQATTTPGVFAAGDTSNPMHNATFAAAAGVMAGVGAHQSLLV